MSLCPFINASSLGRRGNISQWSRRHSKSSHALPVVVHSSCDRCITEKSCGICVWQKRLWKRPENGINEANYSSCRDCLLIPGGLNNDRSRQNKATEGQACSIKGGIMNQPLKTGYGQGRGNDTLLHQQTTTPIITGPACFSGWNKGRQNETICTKPSIPSTAPFKCASITRQQWERCSHVCPKQTLHMKCCNQFIQAYEPIISWSFGPVQRLITPLSQCSLNEILLTRVCTRRKYIINIHKRDRTDSMCLSSPFMSSRGFGRVQHRCTTKCVNLEISNSLTDDETRAARRIKSRQTGM